jgi:hypothetical protein
MDTTWQFYTSVHLLGLILIMFVNIYMLYTVDIYAVYAFGVHSRGRLMAVYVCCMLLMILSHCRRFSVGLLAHLAAGCSRLCRLKDENVT